MKEQERNNIQKLLASIPDEFQVIEHQIKREDMMEFHELSQQLRGKPLENEAGLSDKEKLVRNRGTHSEQ